MTAVSDARVAQASWRLRLALAAAVTERRLRLAAYRARHLSPIQRQALLLVVSLAGVIVGAALIARWAVGLAVIADSVFGVWLALMRDVPERDIPAAHSTHDEVLARYRSAP